MAARREAEHRGLGEHSLAGLEPAEAQALERLVERELELAPPARLVARVALGRKPDPYLPQKPTPGEPDPVAPAHPHQGLDRRALELRGRAPHHVAHAPNRASLPAPGDDRRGRFLTPVPDEPESHAHRSRFPFPATVRESFRVSRDRPRVL